MIVDKKTVLLLAASTTISLLICEGALRLLTPYGSPAAATPKKTGTEADGLDLSEAIRHIAKLPAALGTDRRWFTEDPEPLKRAPVEKKEQVRFDDFQRRTSAGRPAQFVYNRVLVEYSGCSATGPFKNFPDTVPTFDPPSRTLHPPFRFRPDITTPEGLVTNHFGFRGPPIDLIPSPKTVRVAFVGASTTVNHHSFAFSYPERTVFWLNRFAAANHYNLRFEVINAGREGITSQDIAAVVRYEVAPLNPDLVVYYEGANQFLPDSLLAPHIARRDRLDQNDVITSHKLPEGVRALALGDLLDHALLGVTSAGEPRKPAYRINWPSTVDENHPDPNSADLPLELPRIVKDLDAIRASLKPIGGELAVCSFERLAGRGLVLSPVTHRYIYEQLNTLLWPLWYSDIRRLADFQNRVFRAYAENRHELFLDVAAEIPQDPALFADSIHMTEVGERVKAWIVFQQLVPYLRQQIESGKLPRAVRGPAPPLSPMDVTEIGRCQPPQDVIYQIPSGLSLKQMTVSKEATLEGTKPSKLTTPERQWGFELTIPLVLPSSSVGHLYFKFHAQVLKGQIGIGVLDSSTGDFQGERIIDTSPSATDIYVPIAVPETARSVILRNSASGGVRSEIIWDSPMLVSDRKH
jgi:hypothetical protein